MHNNTCSSVCRLTIAAAMVFAALALPAVSFAVPAARSPLVGQPAPAFSLPNVTTGATTSLDSLRQGKKAAVVIFISVQCPVSNAYDQRMVTLATAYQTKDVAFAGIYSNVTEPTAECADHAKRSGFSFAVLKDDRSAVADAYGARHTPEVYVVGANGIVVYHGRIDDSQDPAGVQSKDLANALDDILAGKPVANPETKAFGCAIKRPRATH